MSINNDTKVSKVREILLAVYPNVLSIQDDWPKIAEYMHDFSASNYALTEVTEKQDGFAWPPDKLFKLHLAAESETGGGSFNERRNLVTRDLVKLCLVRADVKVFVYAGYPSGREELPASAAAALWRGDRRKTIRRCSETGVARAVGFSSGCSVRGLGRPDDVLPHATARESGGRSAGQLVI